jgi:hypothetical protein
MEWSIREKILKTLEEASAGLQQLKDDFFIFGSSALILSGIDIAQTNDIDILTSSADAGLLKTIWREKDLRPGNPPTTIFRSDLSRYRFTHLDIEISGGLSVRCGNRWETVVINACTGLTVNNTVFKIPTLAEQIRILKLFGREKDREKLALIAKTSSYTPHGA